MRESNKQNIMIAATAFSLFLCRLNGLARLERVVGNFNTEVNS